LLERRDEGGVSPPPLRRPASTGAIATLAPPRGSRRLSRGAHEQGPVLLQENLPLGHGNRRQLPVRGDDHRTGRPRRHRPMGLRHDAAAAAAGLVLAVKRRCTGVPTLVGLSVNCGCRVAPPMSFRVAELSLDVRAADDATRDAAVAICAPRSPRSRSATRDDRSSRNAAKGRRMLAASGAVAQAIGRLGIAALPAERRRPRRGELRPYTETGMLFVRCGNSGVSHSPRETTAPDADLTARASDVLTAYQDNDGTFRSDFDLRRSPSA
jgi:hypothetical protein